MLCMKQVIYSYKNTEYFYEQLKNHPFSFDHSLYIYFFPFLPSTRADFSWLRDPLEGSIAFLHISLVQPGSTPSASFFTHRGNSRSNVEEIGTKFGLCNYQSAFHPPLLSLSLSLSLFLFFLYFSPTTFSSYLRTLVCR